MSQRVSRRCPARSELLSQLLEVVDLAVEDDADRAVLVRHRLRAERYVLDAEAAGSELDEGRGVMSLTVGTAVDEDVRHPPENLGRRPERRAVERYHTGDPAHQDASAGQTGA